MSNFTACWLSRRTFYDYMYAQQLYGVHDRMPFVLDIEHTSDNPDSISSAYRLWTHAPDTALSYVTEYKTVTPLNASFHSVMDVADAAFTISMVYSHTQTERFNPLMMASASRGISCEQFVNSTYVSDNSNVLDIANMRQSLPAQFASAISQMRAIIVSRGGLQYTVNHVYARAFGGISSDVLRHAILPFNLARKPNEYRIDNENDTFEIIRHCREPGRTKVDIICNQKNIMIAQHECFNGEKDGWVVEYHDNGEVHTDETFSNGDLHGTQTEYTEEGIIVCDGAYTNGESHGHCMKYDHKGRLIEHLTYCRDRIDGWQTIYHRHGRKKKEYYIHNRKQEGICTVWYGEGTMKRQFTAVNNKIHGDDVYYDRYEEVVRVDRYEHGIKKE